MLGQSLISASHNQPHGIHGLEWGGAREFHSWEIPSLNQVIESDFMYHLPRNHTLYLSDLVGICLTA